MCSLCLPAFPFPLKSLVPFIFLFYAFWYESDLSKLGHFLFAIFYNYFEIAFGPTKVLQSFFVQMCSFLFFFFFSSVSFAIWFIDSITILTSTLAFGFLECFSDQLSPSSLTHPWLSVIFYRNGFSVVGLIRSVFEESALLTAFEFFVIWNWYKSDCCFNVIINEISFWIRKVACLIRVFDSVFTW